MDTASLKFFKDIHDKLKWNDKCRSNPKLLGYFCDFSLGNFQGDIYEISAFFVNWEKGHFDKNYFEITLRIFGAPASEAQLS